MVALTILPSLTFSSSRNQVIREVFVLSSHEYNFSNNNKQPICYVYMKGNKKNGKIESIRVIVLGSTTYNESEKVFFGKEKTLAGKNESSLF